MHAKARHSRQDKACTPRHGTHVYWSHAAVHLDDLGVLVTRVYGRVGGPVDPKHERTSARFRHA